jgi:preprotein translocase subunit SecA
MSVLREGIHLRGYANENPLRSYTNEGFQLFEDLLINIDKQTTLFLIRAEIRQNVERKQVAKAQITNDSDKGSKRQPKKVQKVGRNEACPCGSGKKYKQCCGK